MGSEPEWHGWRIQDDLALHVGMLPNRESPALYFLDGGRVVVLAYFRSRKCAADTMRILDKWTHQEEARSP